MTREQDIEKQLTVTLEMLTEYSASLSEAITTWEVSLSDDKLQPIEKLILGLSFAQFTLTDKQIQRQAAKTVLTRLFVDTDGQPTEWDRQISVLLEEISKKVERCLELRKQIKEKHDV